MGGVQGVGIDYFESGMRGGYSRVPDATVRHCKQFVTSGTRGVPQQKTQVIFEA